MRLGKIKILGDCVNFVCGSLNSLTVLFIAASNCTSPSQITLGWSWENISFASAILSASGCLADPLVEKERKATEGKRLYGHIFAILSHNCTQRLAVSASSLALGFIETAQSANKNPPNSTPFFIENP